MKRALSIPRLEFRPEPITGKASAIRLLAFTNFANMGNYREAIAAFHEGLTLPPDITARPPRVALKYGFGVMRRTW
ncbi:MAG: hypothetical protein WA005_06455 [Candidatus Binataceae bacterium]